MSAFASNFIFKSGGIGSAAVEVYDTTANEWSSCTSLNQVRRDHVSCVQGQYLYVVGGLAGRIEIDTIERAPCDDLIGG